MTGIHRKDAPQRLWATGVPLGVAATLWVALVVGAPIDSIQGVVQKILYVHVPCAFASYAGFAVTGIASALYLWKHDERFDRIALASAEIGSIFCSLVIVTGPIWAKATWGHWWSWDPRLTVTLLQWFIYLSYLLLRSFTEGSTRTARFAAVYGIVGVAAVPLNYFAIELFGGAAMHPDNLEQDSLGSGMGAPFAAGVVAALCAYLHLLRMRIDLARQRAEALVRSDEFER